MNWADERYVRLYTRPTADWAALPWQSRASWPLLLKESNRLGLIQVRQSPRRLAMVADLIRLPLEVVAPGVGGLLEDGCLVEIVEGYFIPNFLEAQEVPTTGALRNREWRAREREKLAFPHLVPETKRLASETRPLLPATIDPREPATAKAPVVTKRLGGETKRLAAETKRVASETNSVTHETPYRAVPMNRDPAAPAFDGRTGGQSSSEQSENFQFSSSSSSSSSPNAALTKAEEEEEITDRLSPEAAWPALQAIAKEHGVPAGNRPPRFEELWEVAQSVRGASEALRAYGATCRETGPNALRRPTVYAFLRGCPERIERLPPPPTRLEVVR